MKNTVWAWNLAWWVIYFLDNQLHKPCPEQWASESLSITAGDVLKSFCSWRIMDLLYFIHLSDKICKACDQSTHLAPVGISRRCSAAGLVKKKTSFSCVWRFHGWLELWVTLVLSFPVSDVHLVPTDVRAAGMEALCRCMSECQFRQLLTGGHYYHPPAR